MDSTFCSAPFNTLDSERPFLYFPTLTTTWVRLFPTRSESLFLSNNPTNKGPCPFSFRALCLYQCLFLVTETGRLCEGSGILHNLQVCYCFTDTGRRLVIYSAVSSISIFIISIRCFIYIPDGGRLNWMPRWIEWETVNWNLLLLP